MLNIMNYGGGVNSTAMFFFIVENKMPLDEVVFADTGSEMPQTYETVKQMQKAAKQHGILFTVIKSNYGNIYDYYFKHNTVPSRQRRDCTFKFKIQPIRNYLRGKYGKKEHFNHYIGISYEEFHRMRDSDVKYATNKYPLVDAKIDRQECISINQAHGFENVVKSGCWFCPFTRKQGWIDLMKNNPELYEKAVALEDNCPNKNTQLSSKPLRRFREFKGQTGLADFEPTCKVSGGCFL